MLNNVSLFIFYVFELYMCYVCTWGLCLCCVLHTLLGYSNFIIYIYGMWCVRGQYVHELCLMRTLMCVSCVYRPYVSITFHDYVVIGLCHCLGFVHMYLCHCTCMYVILHVLYSYKVHPTIQLHEIAMLNCVLLEGRGLWWLSSHFHGKVLSPSFFDKYLLLPLVFVM